MQYKKGTFVVVPNIDHLEGMNGNTQAIYFWICKHADESGECFPSRARLARYISSTPQTVDNHIKILIEKGLINKITRKKDGTKENMSNLYQIQILDYVAKNNIPPSQKIDTTPSQKIDTVTIPNINYTHLTIPLSRGKTPATRLLTIYKDCFKYVYGFDYKPVFARDLKFLKDLCQSYTELQLARMLTIFFSWHGMEGTNDKEHAYYTQMTFPLTFFKSTLSRYEAYIRNVLKEDFDNEEELLINVGKYIKNLNG